MLISYSRLSAAYAYAAQAPLRLAVPLTGNSRHSSWSPTVAQYDMALAELRAYAPDLPIPEDLAEFWSETLAETRRHDLAATFEPVDNGLAMVETFDVSFAGYGGNPIRGWLHLPAVRKGRLPTVVEYVGYGGGRGLPHERDLWAVAGYAHFVMDTRGQGSSWCVGETPDPDPVGDPAHPGFMTRGVLDPRTYYYRRVFTDAVRAVEAARTHEAVDPTRVAVTGGSQGGGITIAAAALAPDLIAAMPDVPFLSDFPRATTLLDTDPYGEIARYLKTHRDHIDRVYTTLSYFDVAILGRRANAPALFSIALMDQICPPSTCFAAFNHYGTGCVAPDGAPDGGRPPVGGQVAKSLEIYPFNDHEGGQVFHDVVKMRWLAARLRDLDASR